MARTTMGAGTTKPAASQGVPIRDRVATRPPPRPPQKSTKDASDIEEEPNLPRTSLDSAVFSGVPRQGSTIVDESATPDPSPTKVRAEAVEQQRRANCSVMQPALQRENGERRGGGDGDGEEESDGEGSEDDTESDESDETDEDDAEDDGDDDDDNDDGDEDDQVVEEEEEEDDVVDPLALKVQLHGDASVRILRLPNDVTLPSFLSDVRRHMGLPSRRGANAKSLAEVYFVVSGGKAKGHTSGAEAALQLVHSKATLQLAKDAFWNGKDKFLKVIVKPPVETESIRIVTAPGGGGSKAGTKHSHAAASDSSSGHLMANSALRARTPLADALLKSPLPHQPQARRPLSTGVLSSVVVDGASKDAFKPRGSHGGRLLPQDTAASPLQMGSATASWSCVVSNTCFTSGIILCETTTGPWLQDEIVHIEQGGLDLRTISFLHWCPLRLLGSGGFGMVYEGVTRKGRFLAVKQLSFQPETGAGAAGFGPTGGVAAKADSAAHGAREVVQEVSMLKQLSHPHVVHYYGCQTKYIGEAGDEDANGSAAPVVNSIQVEIFLELCPNGTVNTLRRKMAPAVAAHNGSAGSPEHNLTTLCAVTPETRGAAMVGTRSFCTPLFGQLRSVGAVGPRLPITLVRRYTQQVLQGVQYLHERRIVHRDIKGDNVFLSTTGDAKLGDFGCSRGLASLSQSRPHHHGKQPPPSPPDATPGVGSSGDDASCRTLVGTPQFMAPEMLRDERYGPPADIWSVGCLILEMFGQRTWRVGVAASLDHNGAQQLMTIMYALSRSTAPTGLPQVCDPLLTAVLQGCFHMEASRRLTAEALLSLEWFHVSDDTLVEPEWT